MSLKRIKQNIARLMALVLCMLLLLPLIPTVSAASGTCGKGVNWEVVGGVLTISGSGAMTEYSELAPAPWQEQKETICAVIVEEGVTSVGDCAFLQMDQITAVTLASSVKSIGQWAFAGCTSLKMLQMPGVEIIKRSAFERCHALTGIRLPDTLIELQYRAFYACEKLVSVTIPASVVTMERSVFAHCLSLQNATVLAKLAALPDWTFYNCERLSLVTMAPTIEEVGFQAFHECIVEKPVYGHVGQETHTSTVTTQKDGETIVNTTTVTENKNSSVSTQITSTTTDSGKQVTAVIDAVLENKDGWQSVEDKITTGLNAADSVTVNVYLKGDAQVTGDDLNRVAGKNVHLIVQTNQGTKWHVNGTDLMDKELAEKYDLSYTLKQLTSFDEKQADALQGRNGYSLEFHGILDFKVEVELPIGRAYNRQSAVFFSPDKDGYQRRQAVMIDDKGMAHFYLAQVESGVQYLIGINVPQKVEQNSPPPVSDVIIPDSMKNEYPDLQQTGGIDYIITGTKSSLGINIGQLTIILVAVMVTCAVVVGVVIRVNFKQKLKKGYVPDMSYEDEES